MINPNDDQAKLNEYTQNKKNIIYSASHLFSITYMGHFCIANDLLKLILIFFFFFFLKSLMLY